MSLHFLRAGRLCLATALTLVTALMAQWSSASLAQAADQVSEHGVRIALMVGSIDKGVANAGLRLQMEPGWKTYWRYPGDTGVPPQIDPTGSSNVAGVDIDFPPPERLKDAGGQSIGYHGTVTLPLKIRLIDPNQPAQLRLTVRIGLCRDICLPIDVELEARIDGKANVTVDAELAAARRALPQPVAKGADFSVTRLELDRGASPAIVSFEVKAPAGQLVDVFVEGPEGWSLPLPDKQTETGAQSIWRFTLEGLPSGVKADHARLIFTLVGVSTATTQSWDLD